MNHVTAAQYQAAMRGRYLRLRRYSGVSASWWAVVPAATGDADCACPDAAWQNRPDRWVLKMALWSLPLPWIAIEPDGL